MYELIHAECLDILRAMRDKSVDCIVTDMPYGVEINYGHYIDNQANLRSLIHDALPEMRRVAMPLRRHATEHQVGQLLCHLLPTKTFMSRA